MEPNREDILSKQAKIRLRWMEHYARFTNASRTCRHFGISASTFYLWKNRFNPADYSTLEDTKSRRPKNLRRPTWGSDIERRIKRMKTARPSLSIYIIQRRLKKQGIDLSPSTVARIVRKINNTASLG
jgi:transposase